MARERLGEVGQCRKLLVEQPFDDSRIRAAKRVPAAPPQLELRCAEVAAAGEARHQLRRLHGPDRFSRKDTGDPALARRPGDPIEHLQQLQLIVEVGLEPEHQLLAAGERTVEQAIAGREILECRALFVPAAAGEESGRSSRSSAGVAAAGTGPSWRTSRHGSTSPSKWAAAIPSAATSPLVTCSIRAGVTRPRGRFSRSNPVLAFPPCRETTRSGRPAAHGLLARGASLARLGRLGSRRPPRSATGGAG